MNPTVLNPVKIIFGPKSLEKLAGTLQNRKALLLTSPGMVKRGVTERVKKILGANLLHIHSGIDPYPTVDLIANMAEEIASIDFDVFIGLGGGSVLDSVKALAYCARAKDPKKYLINHLKGENQESEEIKPILAIPTTAGTGSEVTCWGTIWDLKEKIKYSVSDERLYPEWSLLDSELTFTLPYELSLFTALDALSHGMEAIWNNNATPISDTLAGKSIQIIVTQLKSDYKKSFSSHDIREKLQKGSLLAGQASSYTRTALAHSISYPLTAHLNIPHGLACSFTLPEILKFNHQGNEKRIQLIIQAMGVSTVDQAADLLYRIFKETGASDALHHYLKGKNSGSKLKTLNYLTPARSKNNLVAVQQNNAVELVTASLAS